MVIFSAHIIRKLLLPFLCSFVVFFFFACKDDVDESRIFTFTGETCASFIQKNPKLSNYCYILSRVKLSEKSASTLLQLLSSRGNYTLFAPNNESIQAFLDSVYETHQFDLTLISDSLAEFIARNSVIDHDMSQAYKTADFQDGALEKTNMNDRYITAHFDTLQGHAVVFINGNSLITQRDIECENGVVHLVDAPLSISNAYLPAIIEQAGNMHIASLLLNETGWADSMRQYRDETYEATKPDVGKDEYGDPCDVPAHRYVGYTAFLEPDDVFMREWSVPAPVLQAGKLKNAEEILAKVSEHCRSAYPFAKSEDLRSEENAVNQFVSYHLLPERIPYMNLVIHYSELGYSYALPTRLSINCQEYYETMCTKHRRLLKLTEGRTTDGIRINRYSKYDPQSYEETDLANTCEKIPGCKISVDNGIYDNNALNGFYYPIDRILVYNDDVPDKVLNERIRFDVTSIHPELMTNGFRGMREYKKINFPHSYLKNIDFVDETNYVYLTGFGAGYPNVQGDEHNIQGEYDLTLRIPPVPFEGTWEIRWAIPIYTNRGMAQFYIGKDKHNLSAIGVPIDLRLNATDPNIGWVADDPYDDDINAENDKVLRNHGYMKPPMHDGATTGQIVLKSLREEVAYQRMRKIIYTGPLKPDDQLYVRIKNVMKNKTAQYVMDWIEYAPKNVYDGVEKEDRW